MSYLKKQKRVENETKSIKMIFELQLCAINDRILVKQDAPITGTKSHYSCGCIAKTAAERLKQESYKIFSLKKPTQPLRNKKSSFLSERQRIHDRVHRRDDFIPISV